MANFPALAISNHELLQDDVGIRLLTKKNGPLLLILLDLDADETVHWTGCHFCRDERFTFFERYLSIFLKCIYYSP